MKWNDWNDWISNGKWKKKQDLRKTTYSYVYITWYSCKGKTIGQKTDLSLPGAGEYSKVIIGVAVFLSTCHVPLCQKVEEGQ